MRFSPKKLLLMIGLMAMAVSFAARGKKNAAKSLGGSAAAESTTAADANLPRESKNSGKVTLGKYEGVEIKIHDVSVSDEEVESYIQNVFENSQNLTEMGRPAASGDTVNIDYEGKKDGVTFDGGMAKGQNLKLGSYSFIDGFEDGLIGAAKGEKRTLNLTFPADYGNRDLTGQAVTFDVTVNSVQGKPKPELNDEWVAKTTNNAQTTVDQYREEVRKQLFSQKGKNEKNQELTSALDTVMASSTFEVSDEAKKYETELQKGRMNKQFRQYGLTPESYLQVTSMTQENYGQQMQAAGENVVKVKLMVNAIAKKEKLKLNDEAYKALEDSYGYSKDMLVSILGEEQVDPQARELQVANFILDKATKVPAGADDIQAASAGKSVGEATGETAASGGSAAAESTIQPQAFTNQKLFFFDVDGTLVDDKSKETPQSAVTAIRSLCEAGHLVYLNSGCTRCLLTHEMEQFGISCAICGCGTKIIADGAVLLKRRISRVQGIELRKLLTELKLGAVLEAQEAVYFSNRPFESEALMKKLLVLVGNYTKTEANALTDNTSLFDKFCVQTVPGGEKDPRIETLLQATPDLGGIARGRGFYEFVPKGFTKSKAVNSLMERFSIAVEDCYVFGDSMNGLTMFQSNAAHRIAMGEHDRELGAYASYIADTVRADGIAKALRALHVLER